MASSVRREKEVSRKEGLVRKRARYSRNTLKPWLDRALVLEDQCLYYGKNRDACFNPKERKQLHLKDCVEVKSEDPKEGCMFIFSVQTSEHSSHKGRKFLFNAIDNTERGEWVQSIQDVMTLKVDRDYEEDNERLRRTKTIVSKDSGNASMDEEEGEENTKQPMENVDEDNKGHEHPSAVEHCENGKTGDDDDVDVYQPRPRSNAMKWECPNCGEVYVMKQEAKKNRKKPREDDSRNNSKSPASENSDDSTKK